MNSTIEFTTKEYNLIAKNRGIKKPEKMSTKELLGTLSRYDTKRKVNSNRRKILKMGLEKIAKKQNISKNELCKAEKLLDKSIDELKEIVRLRRIRNYDNLTKEDLIFSLLKSESNPAESNYTRYFNNSTNDEIKSKINDIKLVLSRLGNIVTKNDRQKIKKDLYKIEQKRNLSDNKKKKIYYDLIKLANTLNKKQEQKHSDLDDLDYFGIRDIENLFINNGDNYYKPVLVRKKI